MVHQPHSLSVWPYRPPPSALGSQQQHARAGKEPPWPGGDYLTSHAKQTRARGGASLFLRWPALDWTPRPRALRVRCGACSRLRDVAAVSVRSIPSRTRAGDAFLLCFPPSPVARPCPFTCRVGVAHGHGQLGRPNRSMCIIHCLAHPVYYLLCQPSSIKRIQYYRYSKLQKLLYAMLY